MNAQFTKYVSTISYLVLVWLFVSAWISPLNNLQFIYNGGMAIFAIEFLTIHASGFLQDQSAKLSQRYMLAIFYLILALAFSIATKSPIPFVVFSLSIIAKTIQPPGRQKSTDWADLAILLVVTVFLSLILYIPFSWVLPAWPEAVYLAKPLNTSGSFVDQPQTLLTWGIIYYGFLVYRSLRPKR